MGCSALGKGWDGDSPPGLCEWFQQCCGYGNWGATHTLRCCGAAAPRCHGAGLCVSSPASSLPYAVKEGSVPRPLPPVRASGCPGMKGLFRRASALGLRQETGAGGGEPGAQCRSVPDTWGGPVGTACLWAASHPWCSTKRSSTWPCGCRWDHRCMTALCGDPRSTLNGTDEGIDSSVQLCCSVAGSRWLAPRGRLPTHHLSSRCSTDPSSLTLSPGGPQMAWRVSFPSCSPTRSV